MAEPGIPDWDSYLRRGRKVSGDGAVMREEAWKRGSCVTASVTQTDLLEMNGRGPIHDDKDAQEGGREVKVGPDPLPSCMQTSSSQTRRPVGVSRPDP